jgi:hypothetical protein
VELLRIELNCFSWIENQLKKANATLLIRSEIHEVDAGGKEKNGRVNLI